MLTFSDKNESFFCSESTNYAPLTTSVSGWAPICKVGYPETIYSSGEDSFAQIGGLSQKLMIVQ